MVGNIVCSASYCYARKLRINLFAERGGGISPEGVDYAYGC